jgi:hypothetical protein
MWPPLVSRSSLGRIGGPQQRCLAEAAQDEETMALETERQRSEFQRWSRLAIQLNGAADSGSFDHITTGVVLRELQDGNVFDLLDRELPATVWEISKLTDVDRHKLSQHWHMLAAAYEPQQFHVSRNGLALLVAYVLHLLDTFHATIPK